MSYRSFGQPLLVHRESHLDQPRLRKPATLVLSAAQRAALAEAARSLTADPSTQPLEFCAQANAAARVLTPAIAWRLEEFAAMGSSSGILVVQGLGVDDPFPDTPHDNRKHIGGGTLLARQQAILNQRLGYMVAYEAEGEGRLFQDMVPSPGAAMKQTSLSSGVELELHTEQAFSDWKPDIVSLVCARGDPVAATYVMPATDLLAELSAEEVELLRQPLWTTGIDESFRIEGMAFVNGDVRGPMPIFQGFPGDPRFVLDQDLMRGITPAADELLKKVIALYPRLRRSHVLAPGEMLLLDNRRTVHGRSPFTPRYDGRDRFIIRSFVVSDLWRSAAIRDGSLTIPSRFS